MTRAGDILVRCDAGPVIGSGHLVRCISLAAALESLGGRVSFAMGAGADAARAAGCRVWPVPQATGPMPGPLCAADEAATIEAANSTGADVILVDHYRATADYLAAMSGTGRKVAVIDDLADRDLGAADWVLNQNPVCSDVAYRVRHDCVLLRGPGYALLRPRFAAVRAGQARSFAAGDNRVLITLGGSDVAAKSAAIVAALDAVETRLEVRVVLAGSAGAFEQGVVERSPHAVRVLRDVADMAEQMCWADVSLNAGGSTCWELCCLGVPMVLTGLSADQAGNLPALASCGAAVSTGAWEDDRSPAHMADALAALLVDPDRRSRMSRSGAALVDGCGAARAAESLLGVVAPAVEVAR